MSILKETIIAYKNKITNRFWGVVHLKHSANRNGSVLISYLVSPFTLAPWESHTDPHTSYWECKEIARQFMEKGYDVDIIDAKNNTFIPQKDYRFCIDIQNNLTRLAPLLPTNCVKIMHIVSSYTGFQNAAENSRLNDLENRRGVRLKARRIELVNDNPKYADFLEGFGNKTVFNTYSIYNKNIFKISGSVSCELPFPEMKDFGKASKNILWFGGGGAVHKGLDIVLEAWNILPKEYQLHIIGPVGYEDDFIAEYKKELSMPNIKLYGRPRMNKGIMMLGDDSFENIAGKCSMILYPSCSEGQSGSVLQAMHAGLIPVISPQTGIYEDSPCILIENSTPESLCKLVIELSNKPVDELKSMSFNIWKYARSHYTKKTFENSYASFISDILKI